MDYSDVRQVILALLISIPISLLSVYLAFRKYKSEKWWDRQAQCYCDTVNAFSEIIGICDDLLGEKLNGIDLSGEEKNAFAKRMKAAKAVLFSQVSVGHLLMSTKSHCSLLEFERALSAAEEECIEAVREVTEAHAVAFIRLAKNDLAIN